LKIKLVAGGRDPDPAQDLIQEEVRSQGVEVNRDRVPGLPVRSLALGLSLDQSLRNATIKIKASLDPGVEVSLQSNVLELALGVETDPNPGHVQDLAPDRFQSMVRMIARLTVQLMENRITCITNDSVNNCILSI